MPFYDEEDELSEESFKQILHIHTIFAALTNFSSYLCSADSCDIILKNKLNYRPQKGLGGLCLKAWELELVEDSLKTYRTICWLTLIDVTLFLILRLTSRAEKQTACWQQGNMKKQFLVTEKLLVSRYSSHSSF